MSWVIDSSHTGAHFRVKHMMITTVKGDFGNVTGTVDFHEDNPTATTLDIEIDASTLDTRDAKRDAHLKGEDFLHVEKFPKLHFTGTKVAKTGERTAKLTGMLTIRGVSKEATLDVEYNGQQKSPWGSTHAGFTAEGKINRKDWGLEWNVVLESGGVLVGDVVSLDIEAQIVKQ